ncbi:MAG: CRP-like cAMP-binding protein [Algoriphagus sp.]
MKVFLRVTNGGEITISFFLKNSILSPNHIITSVDRANINFKALTDLRIASIDVTVFESLMIGNLEISSFGDLVVQNELKAKVEKEIGLASSTAKERLLAFRDHFRTLENFISHTDIASFLGITNISLSQLRRELMN